MPMLQATLKAVTAVRVVQDLHHYKVIQSVATQKQQVKLKISIIGLIQRAE